MFIYQTLKTIELVDQFDAVAHVFQSYETVIARALYKPGAENGELGIEITLDPNWDYSNTTRKYLYQWLSENGHPYCNKAAVLAKIEAGTFKLESIN